MHYILKNLDILYPLGHFSCYLNNPHFCNSNSLSSGKNERYLSHWPSCSFCQFKPSFTSAFLKSNSCSENHLSISFLPPALLLSCTCLQVLSSLLQLIPPEHDCAYYMKYFQQKLDWKGCWLSIIAIHWKYYSWSKGCSSGWWSWTIFCWTRS